MLEKELLINLTLEEGYENYINFIEAFKGIVEDKNNIIGFLRDNLTKDILIKILNYNLNNTLAFNKIIFNSYKEKIPSLGIDIEDLIKIPNIEDIAIYTMDNLEDFLEEEKEEVDLLLDSYTIDLFIYNTISYYYNSPYKEAKNQIIENLRKSIIEYSNRIIELRETMDNLYMEYKNKSIEEKKESREDYYKELGKLDHRKRRIRERIERLEERLGELEYIE